MGNWNTTTQTISWFIKQHQLKALDLDPEYQRDLVWSSAYKIFLMDTVICNLSMPKIYLESITDEKGETLFKVADGKQRLTAIFDFINGKYMLDTKYAIKVGPEMCDKYFNDLPQKVKIAIFDYKLTVDELKDYSPEEMKAMFVRLNKNNERLSKQELRNAAYSGDFIKLAETLADIPYWLDHKIISNKETRRMKDVEFASELLHMMARGIQDKTKLLDEYYSLNEEMDDSEEIKKSFLKIIELLNKILPEIESTRFKQKGDFYSLFYTIYKLQKSGFKFTEQANEKIRADLNDASVKIGLRGEAPTAEMREYQNLSTQSSDSLKGRKFRADFLEKLIMPHLVKKDAKRSFDQEQKQKIWHDSEDKICGICGKPVTNYNDYEPDHIKPWDMGGETTIQNGQVSHGTCNASKGSKNQ